MTTVAAANFRGLRDLRVMGRQVYYEQLSFWRNPIGAVFTVGFSVVFLILTASTSKGFVSYLPGVPIKQYYAAGFISYGIMAASFQMLAIVVVVRREMGLLKRIRLSPLPTWGMVGGLVGNALVTTVLQVVLLLVIDKFGYGVHLPSNWLAFLLVLVVGVVCFTSLGIATSTLIPNQDAAGPVTGIVFFVLLFLSGLWYPIKNGSGLAQFSQYFPIRHMINATFAPFDTGPGASPWAWHDLLIMAIWAVAGFAVAVRRFRWEPRRIG